MISCTFCPLLDTSPPPASPQSSCIPLPSSAQQGCYLATGCWLLRRVLQLHYLRWLWEGSCGVHNKTVLKLQNTIRHKIDTSLRKCGGSPTPSSALAQALRVVRYGLCIHQMEVKLKLATTSIYHSSELGSKHSEPIPCTVCQIVTVGTCCSWTQPTSFPSLLSQQLLKLETKNVQNQ